MLPSVHVIVVEEMHNLDIPKECAKRQMRHTGKCKCVIDQEGSGMVCKVHRKWKYYVSNPVVETIPLSIHVLRTKRRREIYENK